LERHPWLSCIFREAIKNKEQRVLGRGRKLWEIRNCEDMEEDRAQG